MENPDLILAMKIMQNGSIFGWNSDTTFAGLCYLRMMRLTAEHGWCEVTPYALAGYGFLLAALGREEDAFRFSQLALRSVLTCHDSLRDSHGLDENQLWLSLQAVIWLSVTAKMKA